MMFYLVYSVLSYFTPSSLPYPQQAPFRHTAEQSLRGVGRRVFQSVEVKEHAGTESTYN